MASRISAVVNTRNEEHNLPYALRSVVSWVDEIVVADMQSNDATVSIAESFGARVSIVEDVGFVEPARAFAVAQASGDWVLVLDADELVPEPLSARLKAIASCDTADVVLCPRRNFLIGAALAGSGWGHTQDKHPRFFRKGAVVFDERIHSVPQMAPGVRIVDLAGKRTPTDLAIHHFNYSGFEDFIDRLNRYTSIEANQAYARGDGVSMIASLVRGLAEFLWRMVGAKGFRDGWRGVYLAALMATYRLVVSAKHKQLKSLGTDVDITRGYEGEAERLLSRYGWPPSEC